MTIFVSFIMEHCNSYWIIKSTFRVHGSKKEFAKNKYKINNGNIKRV